MHATNTKLGDALGRQFRDAAEDDGEYDHREERTHTVAPGEEATARDAGEVAPVIAIGVPGFGSVRSTQA